MDVRIVTLPPEQMVESLSNGQIDGFCVYSPWCSVSVQQGVSEIFSTGSQLWSQTPEKVFAMPKQWVVENRQAYQFLLAAILRACSWLAESKNHAQAIEILSDSSCLDLPVEALKPAISGKLVLNRLGEQLSVPNYHQFFGRLANQLSTGQQQWLLSHMASCVAQHQLTLKDVESCFSLELMSQAEKLSGVNMPQSAGPKMPNLVTLQ